MRFPIFLLFIIFFLQFVFAQTNTSSSWEQVNENTYVVFSFVSDTVFLSASCIGESDKLFISFVNTESYQFIGPKYINIDNFYTDKDTFSEGAKFLYEDFHPRGENGATFHAIENIIKENLLATDGFNDTRRTSLFGFYVNFPRTLQDGEHSLYIDRIIDAEMIRISLPKKFSGVERYTYQFNLFEKDIETMYYQDLNECKK